MTAKRKFGWGAALLLLLAACFVYYLVTGMRSAGTISYAQLRQLFQDEKVQEFAISNTRLTAKLQDGSTVSCDLYDFQVFYDDLNDLVVQQNQQGIIKDYTYRADHSTNWLQILLPYVAVILGFILLMNLMARMTGAGPGGAQDRMSHFGDARIQIQGPRLNQYEHQFYHKYVQYLVVCVPDFAPYVMHLQIQDPSQNSKIYPLNSYIRNVLLKVLHLRKQQS